MNSFYLKMGGTIRMRNSFNPKIQRSQRNKSMYEIIYQECQRTSQKTIKIAHKKFKSFYRKGKSWKEK